MTNTNRLISALAFLTLLIACNNSESTTDSQTKDSSAVVSSADSSSMPVYDPALEPLTVGARFSKLMADTLNIKMYEFTIAPGDSAALHAHPDHTVYVVQGGKALLSFNGNPPVEMELKTGTGFVAGPLTDHGKNIGNTTIKLIVTDIYRPRGK